MSNQQAQIVEQFTLVLTSDPVVAAQAEGSGMGRPRQKEPMLGNEESS